MSKLKKHNRIKKIGHQIHRKHYVAPNKLSLDLADWWNRNNHKKDTSSRGVTTFFAKSVLKWPSWYKALRLIENWCFFKTGVQKRKMQYLNIRNETTGMKFIRCIFKKAKSVIICQNPHGRYRRSLRDNNTKEFLFLEGVNPYLSTQHFPITPAPPLRPRAAITLMKRQTVCYVFISCDATLLLVILCVSRTHPDLTYWWVEWKAHGFKTRRIFIYCYSTLCDPIFVRWSYSSVWSSTMICAFYNSGFLVIPLIWKSGLIVLNWMNTSYGRWHLFCVKLYSVLFQIMCDKSPMYIGTSHHTDNRYRLTSNRWI